MYKNYIKRLCNILNIKEPQIIFNNELGFSYSNKIIYVKGVDDLTKFLFLLFHELRHYYQDLYRENNNDEISRIWNYEFDNYDMNNYLDYNIEMDAYAFAYLSIKYFKIDYEMPEEISNLILEYINQHKYLYLVILN